MAPTSTAAEGGAPQGAEAPFEEAGRQQVAQDAQPEPETARDEATDTDGGSNPSPDAAVDGGPAGSSPEPAAACAEEAADAADAEAGGDADAADPDAASAPDSATILELAEKVAAEAKEWKDKYLRLHAEWDTYRRRTGEQREAEKARATEKLVGDLLPVIDDFERTIDYAENNGETGLLDGVKAVHTKLLDVLTKGGVEVIDPAGQAFDAIESQAVGLVEDASVPDETVASVYQRGYKMGAKVLRPAMVTVTTGGPKRPKEEEEQQ